MECPVLLCELKYLLTHRSHKDLRSFISHAVSFAADRRNLMAADVTLGCFTNGTIAQVVTNSLSPLSGQHLYDGSGATV